MLFVLGTILDAQHGPLSIFYKSPLHLFFTFVCFVCALCAGVHVYAVHVEIRGQPVRVGSGTLPDGFWALNLGHRA